jgi:hypothetical protein
VRRLAHILAVVFVLSLPARASTIVYDPINHATAVGNEVVNFAKWAASELHEAATELNTLNTYENEVLQLARMGDPAALRSLPGVSNIAELYQIYGQLNYDYQRIQGLTNPQNLQANFNSILATYKQAPWNGFTALNGVNVQPNMGAFQFPVNDYNVGQNLTQQLSQLDQKKATLTKQRDSTLQSLQSATTQSDVQKYHAALDALNAAIADVNQSEQQLFNRGRIQQSQNTSAQQIYQQAQVQRTQASDYNVIDQGLNGLPLGHMQTPILWGSQP